MVMSMAGVLCKNSTPDIEDIVTGLQVNIEYRYCYQDSRVQDVKTAISVKKIQNCPELFCKLSFRSEKIVKNGGVMSFEFVKNKHLFLKSI